MNFSYLLTYYTANINKIVEIGLRQPNLTLEDLLLRHHLIMSKHNDDIEQWFSNLFSWRPPAIVK